MPPTSGRWSKLRSRRALGLILILLAGGGVWAAPQVSAWRHLRSARQEVERCHTAQAIRHLKICREAWPNDPEVLLLAARSARRAGVFGDCERLLSQYERERGRDDAFHFERLLVDAECNQDRVVERCWKLVEEGHPGSPLLMESLARGYMRRYRLGMARRCLDRWAAEQPDNPQMLYLEGLFHLDYAHVASAAVASYGRAVELDPDHEEARLGLAVALLMRKEYARAAEQFERLRQLQPDNLRVQVGLAECREAQGDSAEAVRLVEVVLAQQPEFAPALSLRGQIAFRQEEYAAAAAWLGHAVQRNPSDQSARYNLALAWERMGREADGKEVMSQFERMKKDQARFNEIVTVEIAQRPSDPALHCELGQILLRSGQRDEAMRWFQNALQIDPDYPPARRMLGGPPRPGRPARN